MAIIFALTKLFDDVVARFAADGTSYPNKFGWREPDKREPAAPRIVWVPGDDASDSIGEMRAARSPGRNPERPLATLGELVTVYLEGVDPTEPENERKQYAAARTVLDAWYRAVYLAAHGTFAVKSANWVTDKKVRRHGATIRIVLDLDAMIPDSPLESAPTNTNASVTPTLGVDSDPPVDVVDDHSPDVITPGGL
jgi:hypothetical protein